MSPFCEGRTQPRIGVLIGSTRPTRICPRIARWVVGAVAGGSDLVYELVDLADAGLPMLDEPLMAALGEYQHPHTKAWSATISRFDGFVLVFPQYNWGYPAVLKNALDFLYHEWRGKPVSFVTYGTHGGSRAAEQIRGVLAGLKMRETADHLEVRITRDDVDQDWQLRDLDAVMSPYREQLAAIDRQLGAALQSEGDERASALPGGLDPVR